MPSTMFRLRFFEVLTQEHACISSEADVFGTSTDGAADSGGGAADSRFYVFEASFCDMFLTTSG